MTITTRTAEGRSQVLHWLETLIDSGAEVTVNVGDAPASPRPSTGHDEADIERKAWEVAMGHWGNGEARVNRLHNAGYTDAEIEEINRRCSKYL